MGILRNGFYSRGYKTTEEIYALTGMRYGDTVFDTTRDERRVYDGANWVTGSMVSKIFRGSTYIISGIPYIDSAKCGQMVGYYTSSSNTDGIKVMSTSGTQGGNIKNAIGYMQFPVGKSYGTGDVPAAVQYSGQPYVWADNTGSYVGQFVTLAPSVTGGVTGNTYYWIGRSGKNVTANPSQIGVWSVAPTNVVVSSDTTPKGFTGTIPIGRAIIRFGETS